MLGKVRSSLLNLDDSKPMSRVWSRLTLFYLLTARATHLVPRPRQRRSSPGRQPLGLQPTVQKSG